MRKVFGILTISLLIAFSNAYAVQLKITSGSLSRNRLFFNGALKNISAGEFTLNVDDWKTYGYCVEIDQHIKFYTKYNDYTLSFLGTDTFFQAAWLVNEYRDSIENSTQAGGLQLAIWKSVYGDKLDVDTGSVSYNDYLTYYNSSLNISFTNEIKVGLESKFDIASDPGFQDLLVYNPADPVTHAVDIIESFEIDVFKNKNLSQPLINKLNTVQMMIDEGRYEEALDKLINDIQSKTDGCYKNGYPDANDWITDCESQNQVYPVILNLINLLSDGI